MDALEGIGHACGHNLIAIAGVAVALALKAVLAKFDIAGTVKLLGTPGRFLGAPISLQFIAYSLMMYYIKPRKAEVAKSF